MTAHPATLESGAIQVNRPAIIDETIDGEVVVVDLHQGSYFSIRDGGVAIWHSLIEPTTAASVVGGLARRFGLSESEMAASVIPFIEELHAHGLLRTSEGDAASPAEVTSVADDTFAPPRLERFTDMEDLLMLDPVHEVDGRGWPHTGPE